MHMPFAIVPLSAWGFALWPVALFLLITVASLAYSAWIVIRAHAVGGPVGIAAPSFSVRPDPNAVVTRPDLLVMTGEIATIPEGGPNESLAA